MSSIEPFRKPTELLGRFGVVKLWPDIKVAEDEVIARLQTAARGLGLECVVIDHLGCTIDPPHCRMTQKDLDFVVHLHFSTPKSYDIFSFVVLWNPLQFYFDFGYRRVSRHLLTHDDFLSCGSPAADDQIRRMIALDPTRDGPRFTMYHSVSDPILEPTLGDRKLFYVGINWERLGKGGSRHQAVLDELDLSRKMRIYGPRLLRGVRVWEGYKSYQRSIPFDGVSMIREINRAGIALVLSSEAHLDAALMSNRLFEALAGGAVVICDQNPFARNHFRDTLLYVNTADPAEEIAEQILAHVRWVEENPEAALSLARRAQAIFQESYRLDLSLRQIYEGFASRRTYLEERCAADDGTVPVTLFLLMPRYDVSVLDRHIANAGSQNHVGCRPVLVVDEFDFRHFQPKIEAAIKRSGLVMTVRVTPFFTRHSGGKPIRRVKLGVVLMALVESSRGSDDLVCFVAPNEEVFANHVRQLVGTLSRNPEAAYAYSSVLRRYKNSAGETQCDVQEKLDLLTFSPQLPLGCCRLLFRWSALGNLPSVLLPYQDLAALAGISLYCKGVATGRLSGVIDIECPGDLFASDVGSGAQTKSFEDRLCEERDIIRDVDPETFDRAWHDAHPSDHQHLAPSSLDFGKLSRRNLKILRKQILQKKSSWGNILSFGAWRRNLKLLRKQVLQRRSGARLMRAVSWPLRAGRRQNKSLPSARSADRP